MTMQIPVGARFVGIPGTESEDNPRGIMVEVYWEQDDTGGLCISGHSSEMQIPSNVSMDPPTLSRGNSLGRSRRERGLVRGIVIDSALITSTGSMSRRYTSL